ncbi:hypothetical protein Misp04_19200 [Micromonospora sp. NBRC 101691]|nr:hypothetical protein Misp04_19200 [Micromonospora sp. NBRC 101691]
MKLISASTGSKLGRGVFVEVDDPHRDEATLLAHYDDLPLPVERGGPAVPLIGDWLHSAGGGSQVECLIG